MSANRSKMLQTKRRRVEWLELSVTNNDGVTHNVDIEAAWRESGTVIFDEPPHDPKVWEHVILRGEPARCFREAVMEALLACELDDGEE